MSTGLASELLEATADGLIFPDLGAADAAAVLDELAARIHEAVPSLDRNWIRAGFAEREALGSTALGRGLAVPHCKSPALQRPLLAVGIHVQGLEFGAADGVAVRVLLAVVSPSSAPAAHLRLLAAISRWARVPGRVEALAASRSAESVRRELAGSGGGVV